MSESRHAARHGDRTTHGGQIEGGAAKVEVDGRPAASFHDETSCPLTVPSPHVGGKILFGDGLALFVLVEKKPGAVFLCAAPCMVAPAFANDVVTGSGHVFYGVTSMLGPYKVTEIDGKIHVGDFIVIDGDDAFEARALGDLATMMSNEDGQKQLAGLEDPTSTSVTTIREGGSADDGFGYTTPDSRDDARNGNGTGTSVFYDPDGYENAPDNKTGAPSDVGLHHELGHANENRDGTSTTRVPTGDNYDNTEDKRIIQGGQADGQSENSYRNHRGVSPRPDHHSF